MTKRKILLMCCLIFLILLIGLFAQSAVTAQASRNAVNKDLPASFVNSEMSSTHFSIDWDVIGSGGGVTSSTHFIVHSTMGQNGLGTTSSTHFKNYPGFWQNFVLKVFLPLITR